MELQSLVKVKVRTLDASTDPVEVTVAANEGVVSGQQLYKKVCDALELKTTSRFHFSLFEKRDEFIRRYRLSDDIPVENSDLWVGKWCFVLGQEKEMIHVDPVAAHLVFLQARHDVQAGKFDLTDEDRQKLEDCLEPGFVAEEQYVLLCQRQTNYCTMYAPHCTLSTELVSPSACLKSNSLVNVTVSKFGVKLVAAAGETVAVTWFEVSKWRLNKQQSSLTLTWTQTEDADPSDITLTTPQAELLLAGVLEMITILQKQQSGASFHADMISTEDDGTVVWENGLYEPAKAKDIQYTL